MELDTEDFPVGYMYGGGDGWTQICSWKSPKRKKKIENQYNKVANHRAIRSVEQLEEAQICELAAATRQLWRWGWCGDFVD